MSDPEVEWHSFFALADGEGIYRGHHGDEQIAREIIEEAGEIDAAEDER